MQNGGLNTVLTRYLFRLPAQGKIFSVKLSRLKYHYAPVAQLDRVSASEAEGRGFDSRQVRHLFASEASM